MNTTFLEEDLAILNAKIGETRQQREALDVRLQEVTAELNKFSAARERIDALGAVCSALDQLSELKAGDLFWKGLADNGDGEEHLARVRKRIRRFEDRISGFLEKQAALQEQIDQRDDELDDLAERIRDAYEREERRKEEFAVEREISAVPFRKMIMPWTREAESERRFRRAVLAALLICFLFGTVFELVTVPIPEREAPRAEIPKRLARLVKQEPPLPAPPPKPEAPKAEKAPEEKPKDKTKPAEEKPKVAKKENVATPKEKAGGGKKAIRKKAERVGVLAFKSSFADLMDETPIAKLGTEARLSKVSPRVAGQAVAQRSLVAIQAKGGTSGGVGLARISRNVGSGSGNGIGGAGIGRGGSRGDGSGFEDVESAIADIEESDRPLSDGPGPGRTDEEIQIVFDRYKATLYRIYNKALRRDPTLRGNMLLRISIEPDGSVSMCKVESTDLGSDELVAQIVARIHRFNFGPKEGVPMITILYPIDFLPAG